MNTLLPALLIVLSLCSAALPARAEDPPADKPEDSKQTGDSRTRGWAIGGGGNSLGGVGLSSGPKDKAPTAGNGGGGGGEGGGGEGGGGGGGGGSVPHGEAIEAVGVEDDSCAGLPPQTYTTATAQAKLLYGKLLTDNNNPDAIDLRQVTFVKGVSIANWKRISTLKDVKVGGGSICIDHTFRGAKQWRSDFFGDKDTQVEGNQWIFAFIKGRWYGGAGEWIRPGQLCKSVDSPNVGCGVFYDSEPLRSWRPAHGELVGIAVSAPARAGQWSKAERSNVALVPWP